MYLAIQEIRHSAARFVAISAVVFLVSYLVYFLTGLAWGLASSYTESVEKWNAKTITMTKGANKNILASHIDVADLKYDPDKSTPIAVSTAAIPSAPDSKDLTNVFIYGLKPDGFAMPKPDEGHGLKKADDVIVDSRLKVDGYKLGDIIHLPDANTDMTIVGFAKGQRFQAAPVLFVDFGNFDTLTGSDIDFEPPEITRDMLPADLPDAVADEILKVKITPDEKDISMVNAIISKAGASKTTYTGDDDEVKLEAVPIGEFIDDLPGYKAQYLTFGIMIGALIFILSLVLGIFMYVLTIQKKHIFGIMKAQGVPTSYIAKAGAFQTFFITVVGVLLGMAGAVATGVPLSYTVPFKAQPMLFIGVTVAFIIVTLIGSLFPIRVIAKIDPIKAIG